MDPTENTWTSENTWASEHTWASAKTQPAAPGAEVGIGDKLGPYKLVAVLGSGGMGTVFVGEHEILGRRVAIKVLHPDYALKPEIARRFMMEARLATSIASESVIEVEDFARTPEGLCYLVMELLQGADLSSMVVRDGLLPLARSLPIIRQVAEALREAHRAHIIHRDLKPENIFLIQKAGRRDVVKLLDFGLAKLSENQWSEDSTKAGSVLGTPAFMSPEQAFALEVDHRTDIYALGVVLFWLVSGKLPFQGESLEEQQEARNKPVPRLPAATPRGEPIAEALASLVADCLAHEPAKRPASMEAVIERLDALPKPTAMPSGPIALGSPAPRRSGPAAVAPVAVPEPQRRSGWGAVIAVVAIAAIAVGGWIFMRRNAVEPEEPAAPAEAQAPSAATALPLPPAPAVAKPAAAAPAPVAISLPAPPPIVETRPTASHPQKTSSAHPSHRRPARPAEPAAPAPRPAPDAFAPLPDR